MGSHKQTNRCPEREKEQNNQRKKRGDSLGTQLIIAKLFESAHNTDNNLFISVSATLLKTKILLIFVSEMSKEGCW